MREGMMTIAVTGACGNIAYSLYNSLCGGHIFPQTTQIELRLLDIPSKLDQLKILKLELEDCCYQNVIDIKVYDNTKQTEAFKDADLVIFLGGIGRKPGMQKNQVYEENAKIFKQHGKNLNNSAKKTCKCLVVANPANTNCMILADNAQEIPSENFTALTRLDYNRFVSQTSNLFDCKVSQIKNAIVWGNHSRKQFCDLTQIQIQGFTKQAIDNKIKQLDYNQVQVRMYDRGGFMLQKKSGNIFLSATKAIIDHLSDWYRGSKKIVSMAVIVKNNVYGIKQGLCYSLPVMCSGLGQLNILSNIQLNQYQRKRIQQSQQELIKERNIVTAYLREGGEEPIQ